MVPVPRGGPLPPAAFSGDRPATTPTEAPSPWGSATGWWTAASAAVVIAAWPTAPGWRRPPAARALLTVGQLHAHTAATERPSIEFPHCVCRIPGIFKLHEGKARGVPGHPDAAQGSVVAEGPLQLRLVAIVPQVPHIDLAVERTVSVHGGRQFRFVYFASVTRGAASPE